MSLFQKRIFKWFKNESDKGRGENETANIFTFPLGRKAKSADEEQHRTKFNARSRGNFIKV